MKRVVNCCWAVLVMVTITQSLPVSLSRAKRVDKYTGKVTDLKQKLLQLQGMLEDLNGAKHQKTDGTASQKKPSTTIESSVDRSSREPMTSSYENEADRNRQEKLKLLAARLVDGDRKLLKVLEKALADLLIQRGDRDMDSTGGELGSFQGSEREEAKTKPEETVRTDQNSQDLERDILALLRKFQHKTASKTRQLVQNVVPRSRPNQIIEEGHFGDFREEMLHAVENRLLDDLKMALNSGFTVKEIINDLEPTDGEWEDSSKREIERELHTLKSLRDNV